MTREEMLTKLAELQHQRNLNGNPETSTKLPSENSWKAELERYDRCLAEHAEEVKTQTQELPKVTVTPYNFDIELSAKGKARFADQEKKEKLQVEKERTRVRSQYGEVSDRDIIKILKVESEISQCKDCQGLPCKKSDHKGCTPLISFDNALKISYFNPCGYEKMRRLNEKFGLAKIPLEYIGKTFDDYKVDGFNQTAVMAVKTFIEKPNKGVYLYGTVGTGKTLLAAIMAQEIIKQGREVVFATVPTISMQIRSTFKGGNELNESAILENLYTVPTLVLDDIGMEKPTRFVCSMLCNVFNERYNSRLQTIMTSNYTLEQLENIFNNPADSKDKTVDGTRIYDRCKQMCFPIELKGNSRR